MNSESIAVIAQLLLLLLIIGGLWGVFKKAGRPGWHALIPIYNFVVLCQICGLSGWFVLLMLIPVANLVFVIVVSAKLAKAFGKGTGYVIGLIFLGFAFLPALALDDSRYLGPTGGD